jgi:NhaP-type Na+/H+ or K+/H+ antiporter
MAEGGEGDEWLNEEIIKASSFMIFLLLSVYTVAGAYIEAKGSTFLHETSVAIFFGMFISGLAILLGYPGFNEKVRFSDDLFFYVALPPIVFAAGYNMKRRKFF